MCIIVGFVKFGVCEPDVSVIPQEAVPGGDADDGGVLETEPSPTSTDLSWSSTPVSRQLSAPLTSAERLRTDSAFRFTPSTPTPNSWCDLNLQISRGFGPASPDSLGPRESSCPSPKSTPRNSFNSCHSPEAEDATDLVATLFVHLQVLLKK